MRSLTRNDVHASGSRIWNSPEGYSAGSASPSLPRFCGEAASSPSLKEEAEMGVEEEERMGRKRRLRWGRPGRRTGREWGRPGETGRVRARVGVWADLRRRSFDIDSS